jgi:hypothetical protein
MTPYFDKFLLFKRRFVVLGNAIVSGDFYAPYLRLSADIGGYND